LFGMIGGLHEVDHLRFTLSVLDRAAIFGGGHLAKSVGALGAHGWVLGGHERIADSHQVLRRCLDWARRPGQDHTLTAAESGLPGRLAGETLSDAGVLQELDLVGMVVFPERDGDAYDRNECENR